MNTKKSPSAYIEWLSAEDMHEESMQWLSELEFIKDEQDFFNDLITTYTPQLTDSQRFDLTKQMAKELIRLENEATTLIDFVKVHNNDLKIMVDGIDQPAEEKAYKEKHRSLIAEVNSFINYNRKLKSQLFKLIKDILKEEKKERRIDKL